MTDTISVTLQRDTEGQFLNIPLEFELAANDVQLTKDGNRLIIEAAIRAGGHLPVFCRQQQGHQQAWG